MWWLVKPRLLVFWGVVLLIGQLCAQTEVSERWGGGRRDGFWWMAGGKKLCLCTVTGHMCVPDEKPRDYGPRCFPHSCVCFRRGCSFLVSGSPSADHIVPHASGLEPAHGTHGSTACRTHGVLRPRAPPQPSGSFPLPPYEICDNMAHISRLACLSPHPSRSSSTPCPTGLSVFMYC